MLSTSKTSKRPPRMPMLKPKAPVTTPASAPALPLSQPTVIKLVPSRTVDVTPSPQMLTYFHLVTPLDGTLIPTFTAGSAPLGTTIQLLLHAEPGTAGHPVFALGDVFHFSRNGVVQPANTPLPLGINACRAVLTFTYDGVCYTGGS